MKTFDIMKHHYSYTANSVKQVCIESWTAASDSIVQLKKQAIFLALSAMTTHQHNAFNYIPQITSPCQLYRMTLTLMLASVSSRINALYV